MRRTTWLWTLTALLLAGSSVLANGAAAPSTRIRTARAFALDDGRHLYTERHEERWEGARHTSSAVEYRGADGRLIARKSLRYDVSPTLPAFEFEDVRTGASQGATWNAGRLELFLREERDAEVERKVIDLPAQAAMDAGFDNAVRLHWKALCAGETVTIAFALPAKLDFFRLRLQRTCVVARGDRSLLELRMEPASTLLRWIVDPVVLRYDLRTRALVEYEGRSNILDDDGLVQDARIVFEDPVTADGRPAPDLHLATTEPAPAEGRR